ncbi:cleavage and polyadenylation specificity factor subunit 4 [Vigna unguiculata]|uniref:Cleavage and polyadenylation specificity factor subunit 4 n=1 Tax=Vigna unguiculata TaxID=3917 RepID=A0A4D6KPG8_VIGUN|nr:cleavage and polyadenylation specificity factor subunit 4 [Vigna unguiculata]
MDNNNDFWKFSDQLRLESGLANLSLNDFSIWSNSYSSKRPDQRRNFDVSSTDLINNNNNNSSKSHDFNDGWNITNSNGTLFSVPQNNNNLGLGGFNKGGIYSNNNTTSSYPNLNNNTLGGFNKGIYSNTPSSPYLNLNLNSNNNNHHLNTNLKGYKTFFKAEDQFHTPKTSKKNNNNTTNKKHGDNNTNNDATKTASEKKFKTLPPAESLPKNETIGGYIFVCNNDTMAENLKRQLFGLPPRYRDSVRTITPGLPLFLYNYSTHQLHGIFEAAGFGGTNIDPVAWEDKKCPGESRFPAQVQVITRKVCEPLEEDSFRPILHHYDGPKFRLELSVPEALSLLDIFADQNSFDDIFKAIPA